ncbi:MAG: nuclear transport factor 2 family protein [Candidatus Hermodarchaeota archaeon]
MNELDRVKKTMETYIEDSRTLNYEKTISVVHPDGRMFIGDDGISKNLYEHWKVGFAKHLEKTTPEEFSKRMNFEIQSIQVDGSIARVKIKCGRWTDYHSLALKDSPIIDRSLPREPLRVGSAPSSFLANPTASRQCLVQGVSKFVSLHIPHD